MASSGLARLSPRTLLQIDAAGAALSAVTLGVVLRTLLPITWMPPDALLVLASLPVAFVIYDLACLVTGRADDPRALVPIACMNASYCLLSGALVMAHAGGLTTVGRVYFGLEVVVVAGLAVVQAGRWVAGRS